MNIILIDGTFELYRHHFALPSSKAPDGTEVGAVKGLIRYLCKLIRDTPNPHLAFSFDHVVESFRNDMFDGYKTGEGIEPELWDQFALSEEAAEALGIVTWWNIKYEADDAIATMAVQAAADPRVETVIIRSPDKDLASVISGDRVVMYNPIQRKTMNEDAVREKFGVGPESIADWLGLVGDKADGIPGIPRWGAKSAATVLAHYKHADAIPDDHEEWAVKVRGAKSLATNLRGMRAEAKLYVDLATLRLDVPDLGTIDDLKWTGPDLPRFEALCERLGDMRLLKWLPV